MASQSKSSSGSGTGKPKTAELREKLKQADMNLFDRMMKRLVKSPKEKNPQRPK